MIDLLKNILFIQSRKEFQRIKDEASSINLNCNGGNIIQDDIFNVVKNYGRREGFCIEILRYPINDNDLCACTFIREGTVFLVCNSRLPLSKQIFAVAHEFFHIVRYVDGDSSDLSENGSILKVSTIDEETTIKEERKANAFAGLLLAPSMSLNNQLEVYGIASKNICVKDIVKLMDIFALPYKAVVIRLFEENIIDESMTEKFLNVDKNEIERIISLVGMAKRWQIRTNDIELGSIEEFLDENLNRSFATEERIRSDILKLNKIKKALKK